jgi:hypothetical protein
MKRGSMRSSYAKLTPYYLDVDSEDGAIGAMPLLLFAAAGINRRAKSSTYLFPSELNAREMNEGARLTVQVSRAERDPAARKRCIEIYWCYMSCLRIRVRKDVWRDRVRIHSRPSPQSAGSLEGSAQGERTDGPPPSVPELSRNVAQEGSSVHD